MADLESTEDQATRAPDSFHMALDKAYAWMIENNEPSCQADLKFVDDRDGSQFVARINVSIFEPGDAPLAIEENGG